MTFNRCDLSRPTTVNGTNQLYTLKIHSHASRLTKPRRVAPPRSGTALVPGTKLGQNRAQSPETNMNMRLIFAAVVAVTASSGFSADLPPVPAESIARKMDLLFSDDFESP